MRKNILVITIVLMIGLSGVIFAEEQQTAAPKSSNKLILKYGMDTDGLQNYPSTLTVGAFPIIGARSFDVDLGYSILLEFQHPITDMLSIGFGATYNISRKLHGTDAEFSFLPIYGTASLFPFGNIISVAPYVKVDLGYNISFTGNDKYKTSAPLETTLAGGAYWGIGAGARLFDTIYADVMYTSHLGTYKVSYNALSTEAAILYTKISLNLGIGIGL